MGYLHRDMPPRSPMRRQPVSDEQRVEDALYNRSGRVARTTDRVDDKEKALPSIASVPPNAQREIKRNACGSTLDTMRKRGIEAMRLADEIGETVVHQQISASITAIDDAMATLTEHARR